MCAGIRDNAINDMLETHSLQPGSEQVKVERHLGATSDELRYYGKYNLQRLQPKSLVIVAGANDISQENIDDPDATSIANRVAQIARDAKELGVQHVYIMGIVGRRDTRYNHLTSQILVCDSSAILKAFII